MLFCYGQCGYDLYAEIHQNYYNCLVHALGMPFVVYGIFLAFPALITRKYGLWHSIRTAIYLSYLGYYLTFDFPGMIMSALIYYICLEQARNNTMYFEGLYFEPNSIFSLFNTLNSKLGYHLVSGEKNPSRWGLIRRGLIYIITALLVQEAAHTIFEVNSDLSQIPNSIAIAPLFAARSAVKVFEM